MYIRDFIKPLPLHLILLICNYFLPNNVLTLTAYIILSINIMFNILILIIINSGYSFVCKFKSFHILDSFIWSGLVVSIIFLWTNIIINSSNNYFSILVIMSFVLVYILVTLLRNNNNITVYELEEVIIES